MDYSKFLGYTDKAHDKQKLMSKYNKPITAGLFIERVKMFQDLSEVELGTAIYCLSDQEVPGYTSAYQVYMNSVDEYDAAMKLVGSLHHWQALCLKKWFMEELVVWREHMILRDFSLAKRITMEEAKAGDGPAARKILDMANKVLNPTAPKKVKPVKDKEDSDEFDKLYHQHIGK